MEEVIIKFLFNESLIFIDQLDSCHNQQIMGICTCEQHTSG